MSLKTLGQLNPPDRLIIFEDFEIDPNIPKFKRQKAEPEEDMEDPEDGGIKYMKSSARIMVRGGSWQELTVNPKNPKEMSWLRRLFTKRPKEPPPVSVKYVFDLVLTNPEELTALRDREATFQELVDRAKSAGQTSLVAKLEAEREIRKFESALWAKGMKRYISELQLLKFVRGCERGLCLDWIQHFTRVIPKEVVDAKLKCDEAGLFDNYVVLHFDPDQKATTKEDRDAAAAKKRDLILFGVMRGSRRLYFIGDWKDEHCDLTLQQIVDKLGTGEKTELS